MIEFKSATQFKEKMSFDEFNISMFINSFNEKFDSIIKSERTSDADYNRIQINTGVDCFNKLTPTELEYCKDKASEKGWELTVHDDEHNSLTYTFIVSEDDEK